MEASGLRLLQQLLPPSPLTYSTWDQVQTAASVWRQLPPPSRHFVLHPYISALGEGGWRVEGGGWRVEDGTWRAVHQTRTVKQRIRTATDLFPPPGPLQATACPSARDLKSYFSIMQSGGTSCSFSILGSPPWKKLGRCDVGGGRGGGGGGGGGRGRGGVGGGGVNGCCSPPAASKIISVTIRTSIAFSCSSTLMANQTVILPSEVALLNLETIQNLRRAVSQGDKNNTAVNSATIAWNRNHRARCVKSSGKRTG